MIQKKICMLGSHGVGKTSLVRRFVHSIFSEKYHSTIGVKIDRKDVDVEGETARLMLWDVAGEEEHFRIPASYFAGSAGNLLVLDGTRRQTAEVALDILDRLDQALGHVPIVLVLNKADLIEDWELDENALTAFRERNFPIVRSSAKTGEGVDEAFQLLTRAILGL